MNNTTDILEATDSKTFSQTASKSEVQTATWALDKAHSAAGFSVRHLMISNVRGEFRELAGSLSYDPLSIENNSVSVTIDASSIDTREPNRDAHLKSADFFEVEKYPTLIFESTEWQHKNDDELLVKGNLTMHGVTKEVTLNVERTPVVKDPWGGTRVGFTAKTKINRKDFGLGFNAVMETGGLVVGEEVTISLEAEFVKQ